MFEEEEKSAQPIMPLGAAGQGAINQSSGTNADSRPLFEAFLSKHPAVTPPSQARSRASSARYGGVTPGAYDPGAAFEWIEQQS